MTVEASAATPRPRSRFDAARALTAAAAAAQKRWADVPLKRRLAVIRRFRQRLAAAPLALAELIGRRGPGETIASEIWPLLEASRFLERRAARVLAARRPTSRGIPLPGRARLTVIREPYGVVLIIGPGNYGLMLPGVQALQALAAGNAAIIKPAPGAADALAELARALHASGLPDGLLSIADESAETARALLESRIDRVVFTGSSTVGREVLARAAARLVPAALELSGWDACIVLDDANLDRVADAFVFALRTNRGETCVAPRRVLVAAGRCAELEARLRARLLEEREQAFDGPLAARAATLIGDAVATGAYLVAGRSDTARVAGPIVLAGVTSDMPIFSTEVFAPLILISAVDDVDEAVALANRGDFALGASVFGSLRRARAIAPRLNAGLVTINDVVAPLADAEVPLAARRASGFGVTRGADGLLAMTRPKAITEPRSRFAPHHTLRADAFGDALAALSAVVHGAPRAKLRALVSLLGTRRTIGRDVIGRRGPHREPRATTARSDPGTPTEHS
jgi:acyl-CoA reductase-like NAD-dependent aldehyde dehydrogenase